MEATIGDQICIHGNTVRHEDRTGEIIEVHRSEASRRTWSGSPTGGRGCCSQGRVR